MIYPVDNTLQNFLEINEDKLKAVGDALVGVDRGQALVLLAYASWCVLEECQLEAEREERQAAAVSLKYVKAHLQPYVRLVNDLADFE